MLSWLRRQVGQFAFSAVAMAVRAMLSPVAFGVSAIIVDETGKVALVRHSYTHGWLLPGGGVARGEAAEAAILRELREELGTVRSDPPRLFGIYTRPAGWATNVIALYCLTNAQVEFRRSLEVRELIFVDPNALPGDVGAGALRRLAEYIGKAPPSPFW